MSNIKVARGNSDCIAGHNIALYARDGQLHLQIDEQSWLLSDAQLWLKFYHDVAKRTSHFALTSPSADFAIDYLAWWADIPDFEPIEPEMDKDEDYLAYVYEVWKTPSIQQALLKRWTA